MLWYIRESSTAVYVSNLPMMWPLFRRVFKVGTFADNSSNKYSHGDSQPLSVLSKQRRPKKGGDGLTGTTSYAGSEEMINHQQLQIEQRVSFTVEESRVKAEYDEERAS